MRLVVEGSISGAFYADFAILLRVVHQIVRLLYTEALIGPEGAKDFVESRDPAESSAERRNGATFQEIGALIGTSVNSGKISPQCIHRCFRSKSVR
jgi:hypothetical protein